MTLNELRFVLAVAEEGNFSRAAERCFVSQPALSVAVRKLEEELGLTLFERSHAQVAVAPGAEPLIAQARRVLEEAERLGELARLGGDQLAGPFTLGVIFTIGPYVLPSLVTALKKRAPKMPLMVEENITDTLLARLAAGKLDAALLALPVLVPGLEFQPLYDEPFSTVVPAGHPWTKRPWIEPHELAAENVLLLDSGHCFSHQVAEACPELTRKGRAPTAGNSLETIRNMVATGLGVSVLPCSALTARYRHPLLKAVPFKDPAPSRRVALVWRKSYPRTHALDVMAQAIRAVDLPCLRLLPEPGEKAPRKTAKAQKGKTKKQ